MKTISLGQSTVYMTAASIGQKIISFVYFAIIARSLGAEDTGKYFFALSFTTIFVVFVDLGLTNVMVREGAKIKEKISDFVSSVLFIKFFLGIFAYSIMVFVLILLHYEMDTRTLVFISGITMLSDSLQLTLYGTLRALGNIKYEALGIVSGQFITLVLGTLFLYFKLPAYFLMVAFLVPSLLNTLFAYIITTHVYHVELRPRYSREILFYIIPIAIPFALATVFGRIFSYSDSIILSKIAGDIAVGWYSVPYKIAYAFQFIPFALIAGLYPRMSEYFVHDHKRLAEVFSQGLRYLLVISLPMSVGIIILAKDIITTFFGVQYAPSVLPLQILMCGVIASYLNTLLGALLNATGKQKIQTTFIGVVMVVNILLNLAFIPRIGVVGAALSGTLGNLLLLIISWAVARKTVTIVYKEISILIAKLIIASGIMSLVIWYTPSMLHVAFRAVLGMGVWILVFLGLRGFTAGDIIYFKGLRPKNNT